MLALQLIAHYEKYPLGNIGRMVRNALHIFGNHKIVHILGHQLGLLLHQRRQILPHLAKIGVHFIVSGHNLLGQLHIVFANGGDAIINHLAHYLQHGHKIIRHGDGIFFAQAQCVLANITAVVRNALHIAH